MAYKTTFEFSSKPEEYAADPVPSVSDWDSLWAVWDTLTRQMIPKDELLSKPIKLRNACIFYLGHIPTFVDLHLSRAMGEFSEELVSYRKVFERGIDPDVENPELCHEHSEIPDSWPPTEEIIAYQETVREKVKSLFASGVAISNPAVRKALWLGFEHEAMHLETLLYMLIQSEKSLPPHGVVVPDFKAMADEAKAKAVKNEWFKIPTRKVLIGMDDFDSDTTTHRYFGWDNEKPSRTITVSSFSAQGRPITNREYAHYLEQSGIKDLPASWIKTTDVSEQINGHQNDKATNGVNGHASFVDDKAVRTVFGAISLQLALDWPVMASYNELAGFANWMGGRIPTMEEVRSIYEYVEDYKSEQFENSIGRNIPAVNGHLVNDGVEETPPSNGVLHHSSSTAARPSPSDLFVNLKDANVGFKHWHPVPVTTHDKLAGQGETGGVWEWTSTVLEKHEGFEPMELYPGYTG
jgi:L-histidine Nalpha-methyltransferase / hercynylcysteine S-oxide synthase